MFSQKLENRQDKTKKLCSCKSKVHVLRDSEENNIHKDHILLLSRELQLLSATATDIVQLTYPKKYLKNGSLFRRG